jgi:hypothetical protein
MMSSKVSLLPRPLTTPRTVSDRHDDNNVDDDELQDEPDSDHDVEEDEEVDRRRPDQRQRHHANKPGDDDCHNEPVRTGRYGYNLNDPSSLFPPLTASVY